MSTRSTSRTSRSCGGSPATSTSWPGPTLVSARRGARIYRGVRRTIEALVEHAEKGRCAGRPGRSRAVARMARRHVPGDTAVTVSGPTTARHPSVRRPSAAPGHRHHRVRPDDGGPVDPVADSAFQPQCVVQPAPVPEGDALRLADEPASTPAASNRIIEARRSKRRFVEQVSSPETEPAGGGAGEGAVQGVEFAGRAKGARHRLPAVPPLTEDLFFFCSYYVQRNPWAIPGLRVRVFEVCSYGMAFFEPLSNFICRQGVSDDL